MLANATLKRSNCFFFLRTTKGLTGCEVSYCAKQNTRGPVWWSFGWLQHWLCHSCTTVASEEPEPVKTKKLWLHQLPFSPSSFSTLVSILAPATVVNSTTTVPAPDGAGASGSTAKRGLHFD